MGKQACDMMGIEWKYGCSNKYAHVRDIFHNNGCELFFFPSGMGIFFRFPKSSGCPNHPNPSRAPRKPPWLAGDQNPWMVNPQ